MYVSVLAVMKVSGGGVPRDISRTNFDFANLDILFLETSSFIVLFMLVVIILFFSAKC